jgi:hypothetical protein
LHPYLDALHEQNRTTQSAHFKADVPVVRQKTFGMIPVSRFVILALRQLKGLNIAPKCCANNSLAFSTSSGLKHTDFALPFGSEVRQVEQKKRYCDAEEFREDTKKRRQRWR